MPVAAVTSRCRLGDGQVADFAAAGIAQGAAGVSRRRDDDEPVPTDALERLIDRQAAVAVLLLALCPEAVPPCGRRFQVQRCNRWCASDWQRLQVRLERVVGLNLGAAWSARCAPCGHLLLSLKPEPEV